MPALPEKTTVTFRVYRKRWIILVIIMGFGFFSTAQWVQYAIISNIVMRFYNVSSYAVDWTSILFMGVYVPLVFPASYLMDKLGLRKSTVLGIGIMTVGTWIKCASAEPSRYIVTLTGQTLVGMSQVFLLSVPPRLAATWFGSDQVSTACSLGIIGLQLGVAVGFLVPPMIVRNHENLDDIGHDLSVMFYAVAGICTALLLLTFLLFQDKPPVPPSAESYLQAQTKMNFKSSIRRLFHDRNFLLLMISYGINLAVFNAFSTLLNQLILIYFKDGQEFAGRVGLIFVMTGMVGSGVCGVILDKTHRFRETIITIYALSTVGLLVLTFIMALKSQLIVYIVGGIFGIFMGAYMTVSFEYGVELMYPESESTMAGMLLLSSQVMSVLLTVAYGWLLNEAGDVCANVVLVAVMAAGTIATILIRSELRRQAAHSTAEAQGKAPVHVLADSGLEDDTKAPEVIKLMPVA